MIAAVHIASSADAYAPLAAEWKAPDPIVRAALWEKTVREGPGVVFVAEGGFVHGGPARRSEPGVALEIWAIHVAPSHRRSGIASALWAALRAELPGPLYADTLAELACCRFYERHGGERIEERPTRFGGSDRTHVTYRFR